MNEVALVLLPGLDGTGVLFRPLLASLSPDLQSIVVGYPPDQPRDYAALLPIVLDALPKSVPFIVLGESFSGPLALMAAMTHPERLAGVILCASFVRNPLWLRPGWLKYLARPFAFRFFRVLSPIKTLIGGYSTRELRALLAEALAGVRPEVLACRARSVLEVDVRKELQICPVPILYLLAGNDRVVPRQNLDDVLAVRSDTKVASISSPHLLLQTHPEAAAKAILDFAKEVCPTPIVRTTRNGAQ